MSSTEDNRPPNPIDLRKKLIDLKAATLKLNAILLGLKLPEEDISLAAFAKINKDVEDLAAEDLTKQIEHWTALHLQATNKLASRPAPPAKP